MGSPWLHGDQTGLTQVPRKEFGWVFWTDPGMGPPIECCAPPVGLIPFLYDPKMWQTGHFAGSSAASKFKPE